MKTRLITALTALTLAAGAAASARADESGVMLEWQKPGYVMDVVRVTAKRSDFTPDAGTQAAVREEAAVTTDVTPAWQEPGYEPELIVVTASRSEAQAKFWADARERAARNPRLPAWSGFGAPAR
jgi:hypothetical protein